MQQVRVCRSCSKIIDSQFLYCPWCGVRLLYGEPVSSVLDRVLKEVETNETGKRIEKIGNSLDTLEKEIISAIHTMESKK